MEPRDWTLEWNERMSVGIPEIDADHRRFIALVNGFNKSVADRTAMAEVQKRLQDILNDAAQHFAYEEKLLHERRYPDADGHARIHAQVVKGLQAIKSTISYSYDAEWIEAGLKIMRVLLSHIQTEDMKCAEFCRKSSSARAVGEK